MSWMCNRCPNKILALILDKMGHSTNADEVVRNGCPWAWRIQVKEDLTGQLKEIDCCGAEALPKFLNDFGGKIVSTEETIQAMRTENNAGLVGLQLAAEKRMQFDAVAIERVLTSLPPGTQIRVEKNVTEG